MLTTIKVHAIVERMITNNGMTDKSLFKHLEGDSVEVFKQRARELGYKIYAIPGQRESWNKGYKQKTYNYTAEEILKKNEYRCGFPDTIKSCPMKGKFSDEICLCCRLNPKIKYHGQLAGHDYDSIKLYI